MTLSKDLNRVEEQIGLAQKNLRELIKENRQDLDNALDASHDKMMQL